MTDPGKIDVLQMLRDAQGDAQKTALAQAKLEGQLDQEEADQMTSNPTIARLQSLLDAIRADIDAAAALADVLPPPYNTIVKQIAHWVDVGDDAFKVF